MEFVPMFAKVALLILATIPAFTWDWGRANARPPELPSPGIVLFTASWCGPCQQAKALVPWLEKSGWKVTLIDIDADQSTAEHYGIDRIPTFVVIRNGTEAGRYTGNDQEELRAEIVRACK